MVETAVSFGVGQARDLTSRFLVAWRPYFARIPVANLGFSGNTVPIFCLTKTFERDVERVGAQRTDFFERASLVGQWLFSLAPPPGESYHHTLPNLGDQT
jgi:hypothetical protein